MPNPTTLHQDGNAIEPFPLPDPAPVDRLEREDVKLNLEPRGSVVCTGNLSSNWRTCIRRWVR